ncbi:Ger(x)C family spore germination protein [Paenibacillus methanolicus]|uniref:Spore germination protein n=1 Tax=Paenibacillus methanolicus TaxID=582686 RepID=A0A5S5C1D8_9BACL|nr:Ger(x)C family spore germination protein [Paenibacillus methanolicus]TYP72428.1 spore germination protein [Paenibacillus methanolicus]
MTSWRKRATVLLFLLHAVLLSACWDRVEIDQRGFVAGVAIDKEPQREETSQKQGKAPEIVGTYQMLVPSGLRSGGKEGGSPGAAFFNMSVTERSIMALSARMAAKTSRTPYFEHLQVILLSNEAVKDGRLDFADILDFFLRNNEMRRDINVLIADGDAKRLLSVKSMNESYPAAYIDSAINNYKKTCYMRPESRIGYVHEQILKNVSFTIQKISAYEDGISLTGAALFDSHHRFVAFLSGSETGGLNFLKGDVKGGVVETSMDDDIIDFDIERATRNIKARREGDNFKFTVEIEAEGTIGKSIRKLDVAKLSSIRKMEDLFAKEIVQLSEKTIRTLQKKYKKDAIGLGMHLYQNKLMSWEELSENWEDGRQLFADATIEVKAEVNIRRLGNINQSERR